MSYSGWGCAEHDASSNIVRRFPLFEPFMTELSYFLIAIYLYGRTTYIVIIAEPVRMRGSGSTPLYITDIKEP